MNAVERYRKRRAFRLSTRFDEEIWRTTERGKHYALETETGEVTKGNIGHKTITPNKGKVASSGKVTKGDRHGKSGDIWGARLFYENAKEMGNENLIKTQKTRLKRAFNKAAREIPDGSRIEIRDKGRYGVSDDMYVFEKHGDKFTGQFIDGTADYRDKDYKDISLGKLFDVYCGTDGKTPSLTFKKNGASRKTISEAKKEIGNLGLQSKKDNGDLYVEIPREVVLPASYRHQKVWGRVVDEPIGRYLGKIGKFEAYGVRRVPKDGDPFGFELVLKKDKYW